MSTPPTLLIVGYGIPLPFDANALLLPKSQKLWGQSRKILYSYIKQQTSLHKLCGAQTKHCSFDTGTNYLNYTAKYLKLTHSLRGEFVQV